MSSLTDLLSARQLVSVVGPGGVGKTLLATETVAAVADRYADGVRIFELAALREASRRISAAGNGRSRIVAVLPASDLHHAPPHEQSCERKNYRYDPSRELRVMD